MVTVRPRLLLTRFTASFNLTGLSSGSSPQRFTPKKVLDIGCGTGRLLRKMHAAWPDASFTGVDLSSGMVASAHQYTPYAAIYQAPAENLPLESCSLDLVTSSVSFHHWSDHACGMGETARVLRSGGIFILADPNIRYAHPLSRAQARVIFQASGIQVRKQVYFLPFFSITMGERK